MDRSLEEKQCGNCGATLWETRNRERSPCPACESLTRRVSDTVEDKVMFMDGMRMVAKRDKFKRPVWDACTKPEFFFKTSCWHRVERHFDRENDLYLEHITEVGAGKVVLHVETSLSEHQGHGSEKKGGKPK